MKNALINDITRRMVPVLDNHQLMQLQEVLAHCLWEVEVVSREEKPADVPDNAALLAQFIAAKRVEGCSEKTLKYYRTTITHLLEAVAVSVTRLQTEDLRRYLAEYQAHRGCSKGNKERPVYFDARTKIYLKNYLESRTDENPALFVSLLRPHKRLEISGVESRLRTLGRKLGMGKVHPHKFRRTLATRAIDKGMPIEQVQRLLGHAQIDTTMQYAMVNQSNVKRAHQQYIG